MDRNWQDVYNMAKAASLCAYSPYSQRKIGAAVETDSGSIYSGCNVENKDRNLDVCAERVVISAAVSAGVTRKGPTGESRIAKMVVYADGSDFILPCGRCWKMFEELGLTEMEIRTYCQFRDGYAVNRGISHKGFRVVLHGKNEAGIIHS